MPQKYKIHQNNNLKKLKIMATTKRKPSCGSTKRKGAKRRGSTKGSFIIKTRKAKTGRKTTKK